MVEHTRYKEKETGEETGHTRKRAINAVPVAKNITQGPCGGIGAGVTVVSTGTCTTARTVACARAAVAHHATQFMARVVNRRDAPKLLEEVDPLVVEEIHQALPNLCRGTRPQRERLKGSKVAFLVRTRLSSRPRSHHVNIHGSGNRVAGLAFGSQVVVASSFITTKGDGRRPSK